MTTPEARRPSLLAWGDRNRIYVLFALFFVGMAVFAPKFFNSWNLTTIMKTMALNACVATGFTIVMICGQLDLSIGSMITFAGVVGLGLKAWVGYGLSVPAAVAAGALVGLLNGLLVTKAKISSFIVTLGTMIILQGLIYQVTGGNTVSVSSPDAFAVSDALSRILVPLLTPRVIVTLLVVALFEGLLRFTRFGRNFYMVGGNRSTAWLAGINTDRYIILAFVFSGLLAAVGGVLFAMEGCAATRDLGDRSLMYVLAATIIGGTSMAGGKGGVFRAFVAVLTLEILYDGIILFGLGNEMKIFLAGFILAVVVLYEAYAAWRHERVVGQRAGLLQERAARRLPPGGT